MRGGALGIIAAIVSRGKVENMDYSVPCIYGRINKREAVVEVPGSKSITARALFAAALSSGTSVLRGAGLSDDCLTFINCLKSLGIDVAISGRDVTVCGCGGRLKTDGGEVYVGSAGTAARFITALLAFTDGTFRLTCSQQMKSRPVGRLLSALASAGARFEFEEREGSFPFVVHGTSHPQNNLCVDISGSSQFLSALMLASVCAEGGLKISVEGTHGMDYVKMTADIMRSFGAYAVEEDGVWHAGGSYSARDYIVEPDVSAACYFAAANRVLGTDISVKNLPENSMQGDMQFIRLMQSGFDGGSVDMSSFSDQALTLAAIAPFFSQPTHICGIGHIRGQECDRIAAIVSAVRALGGKCEEEADSVTIFPSALRPARINTFGDHRVAMSFAVTGLRSEGVVIENAQVCSKTFADFFEVLDRLVKELTI